MSEQAKPRPHMQGGLASTENSIMSHASDLFRPHYVEVSLTNGYSKKIRPIHPTSPWIYAFPNSGDSYIMLEHTRVYFKFKVTNEDGTDIAANANVAVINMIGTSMINRVDVQIGGRTVPDLQTMHYPYKAYTETALSYGSAARGSRLRTAGWFEDDAGAYEDFDPSVPEIVARAEVPAAEGRALVPAVVGVPGTDSANKGYRDRRAMIRGSRFVETYCPLHSDFFQMGTYFPPDVQLMVTLHKAHDDFLLLSGNNTRYKIHIEDTYLELWCVDLLPDLHLANMERILKEPFSFPINYTEIHTKPIGQGPRNLRWDIITAGPLPKRVLIFFLHSEAFNGSQTRNPFMFMPHNLVYMQLKVNNSNYPDEPYTPNFNAANPLVMRTYAGLFDNIGFANDDVGNVVTLKQFVSGMTMFPFDLTYDKCAGFHNHPKRAGTVTLDARFSADMQNITVMAIVSWDGNFVMDHTLHANVDRLL